MWYATSEVFIVSTKKNPMKSFLSTFFVFLIASCSNKNQIACTQEFRMVTVNLRLQNGEAASLDSSYTVRVSNGEKIKPQQPLSHGAYVVLDDNYHPKLKNGEDRFRFVGWKNNQVAIEKEYSIAADDCHIYKKVGEDAVTLQ